jgi:N utilization substance protein A
MSFELSAIINQIGRDKGVSKEALIEALESAMLSAARKHYGHNFNLETRYNDESGEIEVMLFKVVVDQVLDPHTQISLKEAREEFDPEAMIGDELGKKLDTTVLGRIAAQTAKQVIIQKLRDAERQVIFEEYKDSRGEIVNGIVQRVEKGSAIIVNLGRTEAVLPRREQILRERYRQNERIRAMILDIDKSARGPQIVLTRSHPDFLKRLFQLEVPEINEGTIQIQAAAREPGIRAKIAVSSSDSSIDPVGACVGVKGSRVQAVVQELRGEKIDIIPFTTDEPSFVARALQPAEVTRVLVDEEAHTMEVIVADDQLSQAIGRGGVNVRLASKLTGWRIDVRSVSVAEEEAKRARAAIEQIPGLEFTEGEMLFQAGFRSAKEIAEATVEDFSEIDGMSPERAAVIIESAKNFVEANPEAEREAVSDLGKLKLESRIEQALKAAGLNSIQAVVEADRDTLLGIVSEEDVMAIREASDTFFRGGTPRPKV